MVMPNLEISDKFTIQSKNCKIKLIFEALIMFLFYKLNLTKIMIFKQL